MGKRKNILFIWIDALRPSNLSCYGYGRNTSPNIDFLAKNGSLFLNAFSTNNATEKAFLSIFGGRHMLLKSKGVFFGKKEINDFSNSGGLFLPELLKKEGYKTYCMKDLLDWQKKGFDFYYEHDNETKRNFINSLKGNYKLRNFFRKVVHYFPKKLSNKVKAKQGRTISEKVTNDAIDIIKKSKNQKENYFMLLYYNDTHIPYNPKEFTGKFKPTKKSENFFSTISKKNFSKDLVEFWKGAFSKDSTFEDIIARYDDSIYSSDNHVGRILEELKKTDSLKDTTIFLFSDHGESLTEHEIYFDHHGLYDECMKIPLIILGEGIPKGKKIKSFAKHEDFFPTILDLIGKKYPEDSFDGISLMPLLKKDKEKRDFIFMEESDKSKKMAIRTKKHKFIKSNSNKDAFCRYCNKIHGGEVELYDLDKDPGEKINLVKKDMKIIELLNELLENHVKKHKKKDEKRRLKKIFKKEHKIL